jgi:hypothetical protein
VVVGLVGMHHLVVAACHHGVSHTDHASVLSMGAVVDHASHGSADATPIQSPDDRSDGVPAGLVGAAATCLAILLMVVGLALPQILARLRRWQALSLSLIQPRISSRTPKPPDLTLLSVSRT